VPTQRHQRGLIETSAVIDLGRFDRAELPSEIAVSAVTLAEQDRRRSATRRPRRTRRPPLGQTGRVAERGKYGAVEERFGVDVSHFAVGETTRTT
jgi:hypothetical protein